MNEMKVRDRRINVQKIANRFCNVKNKNRGF